MNENETQKPSESPVESEVKASTETSSKLSIKSYVIAIALVTVIILGALYQLEKEGRSNTSFFTEMLAKQEASKVVAVVNGTDIINSELDTSIEQFSQVAVAQGVDLTDADTQTEIRNQSLEVLVNTELLKQEARERGLSISDEEVDIRLNEIKIELGGEEVLNERMESLGIETDKLRSDVKDELLIQSLLDQIFAEKDTTVSEEEISTVYEEAGGSDAGLPSLEEVSAQVEAQIRNSKEQEIIDGYLTQLKTEADIKIIE